PAASASLAGRPPGEGRPRPGRTEPAAAVSAPPPARSRTETATTPRDREPAAEGETPVREEDEGLPEGASASVPVSAPDLSAEAAPTLADQRIPVLTLGVGMALMGLGIGFLGLRMRRR
ncbi:hypothetical protein ACFWWN_07050, partial [Streptomyces sp. NPDC059082]|uniref:hypothetical protein n=1 Tax=Streptomyces sp. NPDC059082 TaxID=3346720 RepID=UPI0036C71615